MNTLKAWVVQFALWFSWSWPFARDVLWAVLKDGRISLVEVQDQIAKNWPRNSDGTIRDVELPWAKYFRTKI